ncbi:MAG: hypothetical protein H7Y06_12690 [Opitutaceae bacterium]|nr:hypothetical protein [Opitutaceae bacterium]
MEDDPVRIAWILGWAVPEAWFAPLARAEFPQAEHRFFAASPTWLAQVCAEGPWDVIAGYSLGTLLMLKEAGAVGRLAPQVVLFAPIFAFSQEQALGGRVPLVQVKYLARSLKTDRAAVLADFYTQAGLTGCAADDETPAGLLQWGLERLSGDRVEPVLPVGWSAFAGAQDALLDAAELKRLEPRIVIIGGATHHPVAIMRAWRETGV